MEKLVALDVFCLGGDEIKQNFGVIRGCFPLRSKMLGWFGRREVLGWFCSRFQCKKASFEAF